MRTLLNTGVKAPDSVFHPLPEFLMKQWIVFRAPSRFLQILGVFPTDFVQHFSFFVGWQPVFEIVRIGNELFLVLRVDGSPRKVAKMDLCARCALLRREWFDAVRDTSGSTPDTTEEEKLALLWKAEGEAFRRYVAVRRKCPECLIRVSS